MLTKRTLLAGMAATGFGLAAARPASAQTYPTRPVKMVVPLPPGSAPDVRHRLIAQALTQLWGQQVIVENRPAGGSVGSRHPSRLHLGREAVASPPLGVAEAH